MTHYCEEEPIELCEMPAHLLLMDEGYAERVLALEEKTGNVFDGELILEKIYKCLQLEDSAEVELEYLYLQTVLEAIQQGFPLEAEAISNFVLQTGEELFYELKFHKVYQNGTLPYAYCRREGGSVLLKRQDLFQRDIQLELHQAGPAEGPALHHPGYPRDCSTLSHSVNPLRQRYLGTFNSGI